METNCLGSEITTVRAKLGLALAGGGFRASLFHLGVLRRMAELDLLRYIEVLSTVSGGSIIGALYILLLKKRFTQTNYLSRNDYIEIIKELDAEFIDGVKKNLRTRLFMNPLGLLRVFVSSYSLGKRMSRLYERCLYRNAVDQIQSASWWSRLWRPGKILLKDVRMQIDKGSVPGGIESYNSEKVAKKGSVITTQILNASSLNSGLPFRFSTTEIGDPCLCFFRYDEIPKLLKRRKLLFDISLNHLQVNLQENPNKQELTINGTGYERRTVSLVFWWRERKENPNKQQQLPIEWSKLDVPGFPGSMIQAEFGTLRDMKLAAWYLCEGPKLNLPVTGGLEPHEHEDMFWQGFQEVYYEQAEDPEIYFRDDPQLFLLLLDFVLELYYVRSAEAMSRYIEKHWNSLTLGEAVAASACFPPVFAPYITHRFYDDSHISRLGLTDGGVYDNVGTTTLLAERCTYIIASDTGGLFVPVRQSNEGRIGMLGRVSAILQNDVGEAQRKLLKDRRNAAERIEALAQKSTPQATALKCDDLLGLAFFNIDSAAIEGSGLMPDIDKRLLAMIRTDLDGFGDMEIDALINHGYDIADQYLRRYLAGSPYEDPALWKAAESLPKPINSALEVNRILKVGSSRFFRALQLHAPVSIIFTVVLLIGASALFLLEPVPLQDLRYWSANISLHLIENLLALMKSIWTKHRFSVKVAILLFIVAICLYGILKQKLAALRHSFKNRYLSWFSRLSTIYKWIRGLANNVAWILGLWPAVLILVCSLFACCSHVFYYLPFKWRTRNAMKQTATLSGAKHP
jgi:predicted acylesterase/phospholipase RssA